MSHFIKKSLILFTALLLGSYQSYSQHKHIDISLRLDPAVRTGRLPNGFTYFIRRNTQPEKRVLFYLANKVGSVLEDEDQRGLAHFIEHMNFNGTKHYRKNELVNYLEKSGIRFGADLNAYTSFNETVYQLPLPTDDKELLKNGLQIMHDWAQGALLDSVEIEKERGVVLEEKRLRKGVSERIQQKTFPVLVNQSRYADRLPIGTDTVLNNFEPETIRRFYKDWYRPDLQALIIVGDINIDEMERLIKKNFRDLKNPAHEKIRKQYTVKLAGKNQFLAVTDHEAQFTSAQVVIKHAEAPIKSRGQYYQSIIKSLFNNMLAERLGVLSEKPNPPLSQAYGGISTLIKGIDAYTTSLTAKPGQFEAGFKALWYETVRVKRYGFSQTEFSRAKANYLSNAALAYHDRSKTPSASYVEEYVDYFLNGTASPGIAMEYSMIQSNLSKINLNDINKLVKNYITDHNRDIIVQAPESNKIELPDEATVNKWINSVEKERLSFYQDISVPTSLLTKKLIPGKITEEKYLASVKATELVLSNGLKVILKPTNFENDRISFTAFSPGGTSLANDADYESATRAAGIVVSSGIGKLNSQQFDQYLAGKKILVSPYIGERTSGLGGVAASKDLETALQLMHLYFTEPRKDTTVYQNRLADEKMQLKVRYNNPENSFSDTINAVFSGYSSRKTGPSIKKLATVDFDKAIKFYQDRFADAANFTFTFVGNFKENDIKPLLEKYLGSLPSTYHHEQTRNLANNPPLGNLQKIVYKGKEPRASVVLKLLSDFDYNATTNEILSALGSVLEIRLLERLREEESGVYSPQCGVYYDKLTGKCTLNIAFSCSPQNVNKLIASALDELKKLRTDGPQSVNVEKYKQQDKRARELQLKDNGFWLYYISDHFKLNEDLNEVNEYINIEAAVTVESIKEAANRYFKGDNILKFILMPENIEHPL